MKAWKKGVVVGAVWGIPFMQWVLYYPIKLLLYNLRLGDMRGECSGIGSEIVCFPIKTTTIILSTVGLYPAESSWDGALNLIIGFPISMAVGALIGHLLIDRKIIQKLFRR